MLNKEEVEKLKEKVTQPAVMLVERARLVCEDSFGDGTGNIMRCKL